MLLIPSITLYLAVYSQLLQQYSLYFTALYYTTPDHAT